MRLHHRDLQEHPSHFSVVFVAMVELLHGTKLALPTDSPYPDFHTKAATNNLKRYRERRVSWTEYQESTIALMMRIVYKSITLGLNPFVVAMTDNLRDIEDCIETITYVPSFEPGSFKVAGMYVQWKENGIGAFAGIRFEDANMSLDERNLSAVLRLLKQRSGADTILVAIDDVLVDEAGLQVSATTERMAEIRLGIDVSKIGARSPCMTQQDNLMVADDFASAGIDRQKSLHCHVQRKDGKLPSFSLETERIRPPRSGDLEEGQVLVSSKESKNSLYTSNSPLLPKAGQRSGLSQESQPKTKPRSEISKKREVTASPEGYRDPRHTPKNPSSLKSRQNPKKSHTPTSYFSPSFHAAQREAAEKRKHQYSSGDEDNIRSRQKVEDSPAKESRDRRRMDPYAHG